MLSESTTAVVARNEIWQGHSATEPYEASWAREAVVFVRALKPTKGKMPMGRIEISPDGILWLPEGTTFQMPSDKDEIAVARLNNFGTWLRVAADLPDGSEIAVLVTIQLKS